MANQNIPTIHQVAGNVGIGVATPSAKLHIDNGTGTALYINTDVADTTTRDAIYLFENDSQATGRQAISWYNGNQNYYKARLWTEVGASYLATQFGIDVADDSRTVATRLIIRNGNVGIGGTTTAYKLDVTGDIRATGTIYGNVSGTAGGETLSTVTGRGASTSTNLAFNGNVVQGGGTARSTYGTTIALNRSTTFSANSDVGDGERYLSIVNDNSTTNAMSVLGFRINPNGGSANAMLDLKFVNTGATNTSKLHYSFLHGGSWADRLTLQSDGNVGIGNTSPSAKLDVNGEGAFVSNSSSRVLYLKQNATNAGNIIQFRNEAGGDIWEVVGRNNQFYIYNNALSSHALYIVPGNNNVGIGTTSPAAKLEVNGTSADGTPTFRVTSTAAANTFNWAGSLMNSSLGSSRNYILLIGQAESTKNSGYIGFNHSGTSGSNSNFLTFGLFSNDNILNVTGAGKVGIGVTAPDAKLEVSGEISIRGSNYLYFGQSSNSVSSWVSRLYGSGGFQYFNANGFIFNNDGYGASEYMRITTTGNIGIGTTSPATKLEVNGNTTIGGFANIYGNLDGATLPGNGSTTAAGIIGWNRSGGNGEMNFINAKGAGSTGGFRFSKWDGTTLTNQVAIDGNGNLGIGTITPAAKLEVNGDFKNGLVYRYPHSQISPALNSTGWIKLATVPNNSRAKFLMRNGAANSEEIVEFDVYTTYYNSGVYVVINRNTYNYHLTEVIVTGADGSNRTVYVKCRTSDYAPTFTWQLESWFGTSTIHNTEETPTGGKSFPLGTTGYVYSNNVPIAHFTGSVGIGTISPDVKLQTIGGTTKLNKNATKTTTSYSNADLVLGDDTSSRTGYAGNGSNLFLHANGTTSITFLDQTRNLGEITYSNKLFTIGADIGWGVATTYFAGNVGIGTSSTNAPLAFADVTGLKIQLNGTAANYYGFEKQAAVNSGDSLLKYNAGNTAAGEHGFYSGGSLKFLINKDGNVGIGASNPSAKLVVNTNFSTINGVTISTDDYVNSQLILRKAASKTAYGIMAWESQVYVGAGVYYEGGVWVHHNSNVYSQLLVRAPGTGVNWYASSNSSVSWNVAANVTLWNDSGYWRNLVQSNVTGDSYFTGGNVGIGTASPSTKLDISGDSVQNVGLARFTNSYAAGNVYYPTVSFIQTRGNHSYGIVGEFRTNTAGDSDRPSILFYGAQAAHSWQIGQVTSGWGNSNDFGIGYRSSNTPSSFSSWPTNYFSIKTDGNVGIGNSSPGTNLDVNGIIWAKKTGANNTPAIQIRGGNSGQPRLQIYGLDADSNAWMGFGADMGGGTYEHSIYYPSNAASSLKIGTYDGVSTFSTKVTIKNDGNVGIGTTSPAAKLEVYSGGQIISTTGTASSTRTLTLKDTSQSQINFGSYPGNWTSALQIQSNDNARYLWLSPITNGGNARLISVGSDFNIMVGSSGGGNQVATFTTGSNVGIGTESPAAKLEVQATSGTYNGSVSLYTDIGGGVMIKGNAAPHRSALFFVGSDSIGSAIGGAREDNGVTWKTNLTFYTNNSTGIDVKSVQEKMRLNSDGNLGINTTSPSYKLDVNGSFRTTTGNLTIFNDYIYISPTNANTLNTAYFANTTADIWINYRGYADGFTQFRNCNIGDGKGANVAWFDGTNRRLSINNGQAASYTLDINGDLRSANGAYLATASGNVGIGTTSPYDKLEVAGGVAATGGAGGNASQASAAILSWEGSYGAVTSVDWGAEYKPFVIRAKTIDFQIGVGSVSSKAYIDGNGNFGIGTTPSSILHVVSGGNIWSFNGGGASTPYNNNSNGFFTNAGNISITAQYGTINWPETYSTANTTKPWWMLGNISGTVGQWKLNLRTGWDGSSGGLDREVIGVFTTGADTTRTIDYIRFSTGAGSEAMRINSNGNVGMGQTSPGYKLDVAGDIRVSGNLRVSTANTTGNGIVFADDGDIVDLNDAYCSMRISYGLRIYSIASGGSVQFQFATGQSGAPTYLNAGNVGIGTTAPDGKLDVRVAGAGTWDRFIVNTTSLWGDGSTQYVTIGSGGAAGIMLYNPHVVWNSGNSAAGIRLGRSGGVSGGAYYEIGTGTSDSFHIKKDGSSTRFYVKSDGNIGIGTTTPDQTLHVAGAIRYNSNSNPITEYSGTVATADNYPTCDAKARIYTIGTINANANYNAYIEVEVIGSHRGYTVDSYYEYKRWIITVGDKVSSRLVFSCGAVNKVGLWNGTDATGYKGASASPADEANGKVLKLIVNSSCGSGFTYTVKVKYAELNLTHGPFTSVDHTTTGVTIPLSQFHINGDNPYIGIETGNVGVGNSSLAYKLDIAGTLRSTGASYFATTSGNVGIGTESPGAKLEVNGSIIVNGGETLYGNLTFGSDQTAYYIRGPANGGAIRIRSNSGAATDRNVQLGNVDNNGTWTSYMTVADSGAVNIGQTSAISSCRLSLLTGNTARFGLTDNTVTANMWITSNQFLISTETNHPMIFITNANERMRIAADGNVGIGTTSPSRLLEISSTSAGYHIRLGAGTVNSTYTYDIGRNGGDGYLYFYGNQSSNQGYVFTGAAGEWMRMDLNGNVGINKNTASPNSKLDVNGNTIISGSLTVGTGSAQGVSGEIRARDNITAYYTSDERLKTNIIKIDNALEKIKQIDGVLYDWNDEFKKERGGEDGYFIRNRNSGIIAQQVEKVFPNVVADKQDGYKAVRYELLVPLLIEAIKEQNNHIENLKNELAELKKAINST